MSILVERQPRDIAGDIAAAECAKADAAVTAANAAVAAANAAVAAAYARREAAEIAYQAVYR